jgi:DNA-3-methyladenine glycosylase
MKLDKAFYLREDVVQVARDMLGKYLFTRVNGELSGGIIVETEAYAGETDRASHAWNGRRTARTEVMYAEGGRAYIYLCYGIHSLFNVVTNRKGIPHAVLIRGIFPTDGIPAMLERAGKNSFNPQLGIGPGRVSKILGIHYSLTGASLSGDTIWLEDRGVMVAPTEVIITKRIGVEYALEDALQPYRFLLDTAMFK